MPRGAAPSARCARPRPGWARGRGGWELGRWLGADGLRHGQSDGLAPNWRTLPSTAARRSSAGSSAYPVSLFTDASPALLDQALAAVADSPPSPAVGSLGASSGSAGQGTAAAAAGGSSPLLLSLQGVSVETLAGGLAVSDLSLDLAAGQHLLLAGKARAVAGQASCPATSCTPLSCLHMRCLPELLPLPTC